jgi:hypothetical protein
MTENLDVIRAWLDHLALRGIDTRLVNGRVRHFPATAYKTLTASDVVMLRTHRAEIKQAILDGFAPPVAAEFSIVDKRRIRSEAPPATPVERCPSCNQSPCIGPTHHAFDALHPHALEQRRQEDHAREFWIQLGRKNPRLAYALAFRELTPQGENR